MFSSAMVIVFACFLFCLITSGGCQTVDVSGIIMPGNKKQDTEKPGEYGSIGDISGLESFNRPEGTVALQTKLDGKTSGITSGRYGSYRKEEGWQKAVADDVQRHMFVQNTLRHSHPWLFKMKTPSLVGFGMDGFWNSYAPIVPQGLLTPSGTVYTYDWLQAMSDDVNSNTFVHGNVKQAFPWLPSTWKTPSLQGFGLDGYWNSNFPIRLHFPQSMMTSDGTIF